MTNFESCSHSLTILPWKATSLTDTRQKLREAEYFLGEMKAHHSDRERFEFSLSAFLSAARSVTFFMQEEFCNVPGFKKWYDAKQVEMQRDDAMTLFNKKRRSAIHVQPIKPQARIRIATNQSNNTTSIRWLWCVEELSDKDIMTASEEHLSKLRGSVDESESRFNYPEEPFTIERS